jgi:hypothetical protein
VRSPADFGMAAANLAVFTGNVSDPAAIGRAMRDQDAVISALGVSRTHRRARCGTFGPQRTTRISKALQVPGPRNTFPLPDVLYNKIPCATLLLWPQAPPTAPTTGAASNAS